LNKKGEKMIYISVALGIEAKPIIKYFNLKRDNSIKKLQVFKNERVTLIITGVGILKSAIALTYILSQSEIDEDDIFLNIGICGAKSEKYSIGDIVLCNKIINSELEKSYYPDMVFNHYFKEGSLESFNTPVYCGDEVVGDLVDMEGAGLFEATTYFFQSYQLNFIKIVSDYLDREVEKNQVEELILKSLPQIDNWLVEREKFKVEKEIDFSLEEKNMIEELIKKARFTATMENELKNLLLYYKLQGKNTNRILEKYRDVEIKDKRDSKKILEEIKEIR
jgi:adenosylhomocysteine nucleosidase